MWLFKKLDEGADWVAGKVGDHPFATGALVAGGAVATVATGGLLAIPLIVGAGVAGGALVSGITKDPGMQKKEEEVKK
jgi:hypothetical protein